MPAPLLVDGEIRTVTIRTDAFRQLLADLGLTGTAAAAYFGCGQASISRLCRGIQQPGPAFIARLTLKLPQIQEQLGRPITLADLLEFDGRPDPARPTPSQRQPPRT